MDERHAKMRAALLARRATTDEKKIEFLARVYEIWADNPELRFGQLLRGAYPYDDFYVEDFEYLEKIEKKYITNTP